MNECLNEVMAKCMNHMLYAFAYCSFQFLCLRTNHFRPRGCFLKYIRQDYQTTTANLDINSLSGTVYCIFTAIGFFMNLTLKV